MKKIFIILCILVIFGTCANIYAEDNITDDALNIVETTDCGVNSIDENDNYSSIITENDICAVSVYNDDELSLPSHNEYSASLITNGFSEGGLSTKIKVKLTPSSSSSNTYDFFLKIAKPNQIYKINQRFSGQIPSSGGYVYLPINTTRITSGLYEMSIINSKDGYIMDTSNLTVTGVSPFYDDYSVVVNTDFITYNTKSSISLIISQAPLKVYSYGYDFYVKIYDSTGKLKINEKFCSYRGGEPTYVYEYCYINSGQLESGDYIIKIVNSRDEEVMYTKNLKVGSRYGWVNIDAQASYESGGYIKMNIYSNNSYYIYDCDLKVYDSNKNLIICQRYSNNVPSSNSQQQIYIINSSQLASGNYSIEVVDKYIVQYYENNKLINYQLTLGTVTLMVSEKSPNVPINDNNNSSVSNQSSQNLNHVSQKTKITNNKISLKLKTVKVKKSSKKLVLQATLKQGNKALNGKKISFKFNGKKYTAKTNKNGIAKVTIKKAVLKKLKLGKTVKYQASYGKIIAKKTAKVKK